DGVRDRGDVREGARKVVPLRAGAAPRREAAFHAETDPEVVRDARTVARLFRPPGELRRRRGHEGPRALRRRVPAVHRLRPKARRLLARTKGRDHARSDDLRRSFPFTNAPIIDGQDVKTGAAFAAVNP